MPSQDSRSATRRKLGRGLGSLISTPVRVDVGAGSAVTTDRPTPVQPAMTLGSPPVEATLPASVTSSLRDGLHSLPIRSIIPNPRQPRQHFDEAALNALAGSIKVSGVMQPVVVRLAQVAVPGVLGQAYELIAGERRWRAAQVAGLATIPAVVRDVDDRTAAEFSLVENIQREDLNPLERAEAFDRLMREFHLTHNEIAERVSLDRSSVSNHLRLLELDDVTKAALRDGRLGMGHARALLAITNIEQRKTLAAEALRNEWSVREIERQAREGKAAKSLGSAAGPKVSVGGGDDRDRLPSPMSSHLADLQKALGDHLGTKVQIHLGRTKGSGKLVIDFYTIDQFEGLLQTLGVNIES